MSRTSSRGLVLRTGPAGLSARGKPSSSMVTMILNGYAVHSPKLDEYDKDWAQEPRENKSDLYAICPDFG